MPPPDSIEQRRITVLSLFREYTALGVRDHFLGSAVPSAYVRSPGGQFQGVGVDPDPQVPAHVVTAGEGLVYVELRGNYQFPREFVIGPRDQVDGTSVSAGRGASFEAGTALRFGGDGVLAWQDGDQLVVACPNLVGTRFLQASVALGATMIAPFANEAVSVPVSAAQGDELWILQQRRSDVAGVRYYHHERALHLTGIEQTAGTTADATGSFIAPLTAAELELDLRLSQFAAVSGADPVELKASAALVYQPFGLPRGFGTVSHHHELMTVELSALRQDTMVSLPYGNPFPSSWPIYLELQTSSKAEDYALPGTPPLLLAGGLSLDMPASEVATAPLAPRVGPVRDLLVDGMPAAGATQVSETATLSWQAPAFGTASGFAVDVLELHVEGAGTAFPFTALSQVARFFTTERSVQVLPGLLSTGKTYFYQVTALSGGIDVLSAPHRLTAALGTSRTLSGKFTR